jgi:hypothetical protein
MVALLHPLHCNDKQYAMPYSLKEAADATGRQKTTILRAIQRGKISATKDAHGEWEIDPAELHRVYEPALAAPAALSKIERLHASINSTEDDAAQREIALLREMLADKNAVIEDLREDRDRWRTQAEKLLLTDQRAKATAGEIITMPPPTAATTAPISAAPAPPGHVSPTVPTEAPPAATAAPAADKAVQYPPRHVTKKAAPAPKRAPKAEIAWWRKMIGGR